MSTHARSKFSDPEINLLWAMASKMIDWINFAWQFYLAATGVVVGWLFSGGRSLTLPQKYAVTLIFTLIYLMSLGVLIKTYLLLNRTLIEFKAATADLEFHTARFKKIFQKNPGWLYWTAGLTVHLAWYLICLFSVWMVVQTIQA